MSSTQLLTAEQMSFLTEMMNVGAGNAAAALEQMLKCQVDLLMPQVFVVPTAQAPSILGNPSSPVICVRMGMVGDVTGEVFFIVPDEHHNKLAYLMGEEALRPAQLRRAAQDGAATNERVLSTIGEIANIVAGV